jgi:hypothetical protein
MYAIATELGEWIELTPGEARTTFNYFLRHRGTGIITVRKGPKAFEVRSAEFGARYAIPYESPYGVRLNQLLNA